MRVHTDCARSHRSLRKTLPAACGCLLAANHLHRSRRALQHAPAGLAHADSGSLSHCPLCDVAGAGNLVGDCRNISQPNSQRINVYCHLHVVGCVFPANVHTSGFNSGLGPPGTFWPYATICLTGLVFLSSRLPETRGKTLEQIEATRQTLMARGYSCSLHIDFRITRQRAFQQQLRCSSCLRFARPTYLYTASKQPLY